MTQHPHGWLVEEKLTQSVIGAFYAVHRTLGFGFLERIYMHALQVELEYRGHRVVREYPVTIVYRGVEIGNHRLDMVVDGTVVVEGKAVEHLPRGFTRQVYNYLRATEFEVGLFLHFGRSANFYRLVSQNDQQPREESQPVR
jgi:GxxExxY protein